MEWTDEALVLAARPHGEGAAVVQLLTRTKGRHAGLFHGGATRRRGLVEPGNRVVATWRARLAEHLGTYTLEAIRHYAAGLMDDPRRLAALAAACAVADGALPEREPHGGVFDAMAVLLEALAAPDDDVWPTVYVRWEIGLVAELGFGLDLSRCAATGAGDGLIYVSPRTGRAVSRDAGEPYKEKLLALPDFLVNGGVGDAESIVLGLELTGHFLAAHVFGPLNRPLPPARSRLVEQLQRSRATS